MIAGLAVVVPLLLAGVWYLDARPFFDFVGIPAIIGWTAYRQFQRERKKWESLVLELCTDKLTRTLHDFPVLEISPSDVTTIVESSRGIWIRANSRRKGLAVSANLIDYDDFRNRLAAWAPMAKTELPPRSWYRSIIGIVSVLWCVLMFGGPLYLMYTPHRELILPLGVGLFIGMVATIGYYRRSPDMPISFQRTSWILLLFPLIATISRLAGN